MSFQDESGSNGAAMPTEAEGESSLAAVHSASEVPPVSAASQDVYSNGVSVHAAQPRRPFSPMAGRCTGKCSADLTCSHRFPFHYAALYV